MIVLAVPRNTGRLREIPCTITQELRGKDGGGQGGLRVPERRRRCDDRFLIEYLAATFRSPYLFCFRQDGVQRKRAFVSRFHAKLVYVISGYINGERDNSAKL